MDDKGNGPYEKGWNNLRMCRESSGKFTSEQSLYKRLWVGVKAGRGNR